MAPEEWPIAAPAADRAVDPARPAGRSRLPTVRRDFFLDPAERLSEQERALMTSLLHGLVFQIADEIRAALPSGLGAANDDDNSEVVAELSRAGLLDRPDLIGLLLRCADEERIASAMKARGEARHSRFLQSLVGDEDAGISAAAMAVILGRGRRRDRFGQPVVEFDDVPRSTAGALVHTVAAAIRLRLPGGAEAEAADHLLVDASSRLLRRHDATRRIDSIVASLVQALDLSGKLDEATLEAAAEEGDIAFLAEALARRADVPIDSSWDYLLAGRGGRAMVLLRMAGLSRDFAARTLAGLGELLGIADLAEEITRFDTLGESDIAAAQAWLRLDPDYRDALSVLEQGSGHPAF